MIGSPYTHRFTVPPSAIDANGHVNNVTYVSWMQDVAIAHSDRTGSTALAQALGGTWVVREHTVEYLRPLFVDDEVELRTWIEDAQAVRSTRNYEFKQASTGKVVARGRTMWVFVDATSGRPRAIPAEVLEAFRSV